MSTQVKDADENGEEHSTEESTTPVIEDITNAGFEAVVDADVLDGFIDPATVLVDEAKIHLNEDGLAMRAVDPANVGMVDASLREGAFETYRTSGGLLGVDLGRFQEVIGFADPGEVVRLALDAETRKLHIHVGGIEYTLTLIDPESIRQEPDIPELDLAGEVIVEASELSRGVTAAEMVSDHIALGIDEEAETFVVDADGDHDDVHLELDAEDLIDITPGAARSLYSLDFVKDMDSAIPKDAGVRLELGEEFPVKMHFSTAESDVQVTFMLAPRIQSD